MHTINVNVGDALGNQQHHLHQQTMCWMLHAPVFANLQLKQRKARKSQKTFHKAKGTCFAALNTSKVPPCAFVET